MNRRSFFTSLGAIVAAASAPALFLPKFEPVRWRVLRPVLVPNPAWVKAEYEIYFIDQAPRIDEAIFESWEIRPRDQLGGWDQIHGVLRPPTDYPMRYNLDSRTGKHVWVPPFVPQ